RPGSLEHGGALRRHLLSLPGQKPPPVADRIDPELLAPAPSFYGPDPSLPRQEKCTMTDTFTRPFLRLDEKRE
ncbi:MAG: hypothetical protein VX973_07250, partial [Pseudomonadota bacterium]|nr:hypothetical protein [Pseudomonadota bacterium]